MSAAAAGLAGNPGEAGRHQQIAGAEPGDAGVAQPEQRRVDAAAPDVQHVLHPGLAGRG
ncbi:MAG: hypothetical protein ACLPKI_07055 [Streptosporangiaceae bacterium]